MPRPARPLERTFGRKGVKTYGLRFAVQAGFSLLLIFIGLRFAQFVRALEAGEGPLPHRPPGVEGFLPISGFMGAVDWVRQGTLNSIHPAATVLFLLFTAMAFLLRKSFCAWICPVGLVSDLLARLGRFTFGRNFRIWSWIDVPLRGLRYVLLGFFVWVILGMDPVRLQAFVHGDYNKLSDVKMYRFFADMSSFAGAVLTLLAIASIFVHGFWCRYLCPYGAWLGFFSWLSPVKVRRDLETCTDCGQCAKVCPARLAVCDKVSITSVECTGCLDCVASCPSPTALTVGTRRRRIGVAGIAVATVLTFATGYVVARAAGLWDNAIDDAEYRRLTRTVDQVQHAR